MRPKRSSLTAAEMPKGTIPHSPRDLIAIPTTTTTSTSTPTSPSPSSPHTLGTIPISSVGWAATPPAPQHQQPQPVTPPPGTANDKFQQKFKHWQDSITLDKVVASSSNLFKFIGGKSPSATYHNINDPDDEWTPWLAGATIAFREPGNPFHTSGLHLVSASKPMGVQDGQVHCQWYRVVHPNHRHWLLLQGATQRTYMPSIDDVGVTVGLSCHVSRLGVSSPVKLIELTHPLVIDPSVEDTTRMMVEAGSALFSATLASSELVSFQLKVNSTHVVVIQISEDDFNTVVDAPYDGHLHVYLDPEDPTRFILRFRPLGDAVGTCDTGLNPTIHQATLATLHLTAQSASTRDIIASTVRTFRANRLSADVDASARDVEANYFGEVVDKAKLTAPAVSLLVSDKTDGDCPSLSEDVRGVALVGDGKSPPVQTMTETAAAADDVAILKKQLASQALLLKATQNERNFMAVAVEVRERKLEDQAAAHKLLQATVDTLRGELQVAHAAIARTKQVEANAQQMERSLSDLRQTNQELEAQLAALRSHDHEVDAKWAALDEDCRTVRAELAAQQALYMTLVEERNALKAKTTDLSKELRRLLKHGQSVGDLEAHLIERTQLQIDLAEAKADVKRYMDEMNEFKNALDCHVKQRGMGDVEMQRVLSQNKELQRLVTHFSTSLSASQDQVAKWKKLFDSSPLKHVMTTQRRLSKSTSFQRNEQLVFDEDDEEEEEEDEEEEEE
ncbi:hypothetical protein, variant [Aphanomyces astaci]|nr:hypothetical protein, variant [Aphanomyces astaci]ETV67085.1 hypothetical protein, variant [Aphanomyces astaci]|eukprot:XP_009843454.1 hypothetical protein, variant [Aphanomyces astaci]